MEISELEFLIEFHQKFIVLQLNMRLVKHSVDFLFTLNINFYYCQFLYDIVHVLYMQASFEKRK